MASTAAAAATSATERPVRPAPATFLVFLATGLTVAPAATFLVVTFSAGFVLTAVFLAVDLRVTGFFAVVFAAAGLAPEALVAVRLPTAARFLAGLFRACVFFLAADLAGVFFRDAAVFGAVLVFFFEVVLRVEEDLATAGYLAPYVRANTTRSPVAAWLRLRPRDEWGRIV